MGGAIKATFRVGLIFAAVSSICAVMYDWRSLKTKQDDEHDQRSSEGVLENAAEA